jgi:hypothetical protein
MKTRGIEVTTMRIELPLAEMTIADKLQAMEALWEDLSSRADQLPSPDWHRDVLHERRRLVESGQLEFQNWDTAIAELRGELRGNLPS